MPRALLALTFLWRAAQYTVRVYIECSVPSSSAPSSLFASFVRNFFFGSRCYFFFQNYERRTRQAKPNTTNHATVHTFSHRKIYQREFSMQFFEFVRPFLRLCVCLSSCSARSRPSVMMICATAWFNRILFGPFFRGFRRDTSYAVYNGSTRMIRIKKYFVFIFSAAHVDSPEGNSGYENGINIFISFFKRNVQNIVQHSVLKITFCRVELNFSFCISFNFIFLAAIEQPTTK